jgi:hypothetical protein
MIELYLYSLMCLHGIVLKELRTGKNLPIYLLVFTFSHFPPLPVHSPFLIHGFRKANFAVPSFASRSKGPVFES